MENISSKKIFPNFRISNKYNNINLNQINKYFVLFIYRYVLITSIKAIHHTQFMTIYANTNRSFMRLKNTVNLFGSNKIHQTTDSCK